MAKIFREITFMICSILLFSGGLLSCDDDDDVVTKDNDTQTLLMYMPWSSTLTSYFLVNIEDMQKAIATGILKNERVLVFLATSTSRATLYELVKEGEICQKVTLKDYENHPCTTAEGITAILEDVKRFAPAHRYSMTIGGHGMGWIPVSKSRALRSQDAEGEDIRYHWEYDSPEPTRYFGGTTSAYQTDITTLAEGIAGAGIKMEYILFDDCYMSGVEVAYDLRHVTNYLIASTSEVMAYGMPYEKMAEYMVGDINYDSICGVFYDFYSNYSTPCGTIAVTRMDEMENLATIMKEINGRYSFNESLRDSLQRLDGYTPVIFYDYGDYVSHLCEDKALFARFNEQLNRTVPYYVYTSYIYSAINGRKMKVDTFSGLTTSAPSTHRLTAEKAETAWYKATHEAIEEDIQ